MVRTLDVNRDGKDELLLQEGRGQNLLLYANRIDSTQARLETAPVSGRLEDNIYYPSWFANGISATSYDGRTVGPFFDLNADNVPELVFPSINTEGEVDFQSDGRTLGTWQNATDSFVFRTWKEGSLGARSRHSCEDICIEDPVRCCDTCPVPEDLMNPICRTRPSLSEDQYYNRFADCSLEHIQSTFVPAFIENRRLESDRFPQQETTCDKLSTDNSLEAQITPEEIAQFQLALGLATEPCEPKSTENVSAESSEIPTTESLAYLNN